MVKKMQSKTKLPAAPSLSVMQLYADHTDIPLILTSKSAQTHLQHTLCSCSQSLCIPCRRDIEPRRLHLHKECHRQCHSKKPCIVEVLVCELEINERLLCAISWCNFLKGNEGGWNGEEMEAGRKVELQAAY